MPQIYISKYNRFADAVLNRINRMLGKQYDPVRVKLLSQNQRTVEKAKKNKKNVAKKNKNNAAKDNKRRTANKTNKMGEWEIARSKYELINGTSTSEVNESTAQPEFVLISKAGSASENNENKNVETTENRASPLRQNNKRKETTSNKKPNNRKKNNTKKTTNKTKQTSSAANKQKARATLFGLSTLKRDGDVTVNMLADYTTVKTNFVVGPLTLRVEREMAKSGKRELRSATATTAEMYGRLNLRLVHGGAATLQSIRVLQPKQVRIDTKDNHDKTTEFMWKRSPQIASMVSNKLAAVARSMLKPPPQPRP